MRASFHDRTFLRRAAIHIDATLTLSSVRRIVAAVVLLETEGPILVT